MGLSDEEKDKIREEELFRAEARARAEAALKPEPAWRSGCGGCLAVVLIGVVGLVGFGIFQAVTDLRKTPEQRSAERRARDDEACNRDQISALVMSQQFVTKLLKAPSTAVFPSGTSHAQIKNIGNCTYEVHSYVDAENSFGAKLRNQYTAVVKYERDGRWSAQRVSLDDG